MSSHGVGLGPSKKGRTADSSMVTRNIKVVAQGQADATYASTQKKNPFRLSSAILNGGAYGGEAVVRQNMQNAVPTTSSEPAPPPPAPDTFDLFSPFNVADWQLNNGYSRESTNPVGITIMTASPFAPNPGSPRSSSFYTKTQLDLTKSFVLSATFLTRTFVQAPPDGIAVAISADPATFGGNGGGVGIFNSSPPFSATTYPVLAVVMKSFSSKTTYLQVANTSGTAPTGPNNVSITDIVTDMTSINNLSITVVITYTSESGTLAWTITDSNNKTASNTYINADLPTLLGVNNGYIGVGVGAGGKIQPVFLIGMSYTQ